MLQGSKSSTILLTENAIMHCIPEEIKKAVGEEEVLLKNWHIVQRLGHGSDKTGKMVQFHLCQRVGNTVVVCLPSKQITWVRFPSGAPVLEMLETTWKIRDLYKMRS